MLFEFCKQIFTAPIKVCSSKNFHKSYLSLCSNAFVREKCQSWASIRSTCPSTRAIYSNKQAIDILDLTEHQYTGFNWTSPYAWAIERHWLGFYKQRKITRHQYYKWNDFWNTQAPLLQLFPTQIPQKSCLKRKFKEKLLIMKIHINVSNKSNAYFYFKHLYDAEGCSQLILI